MHIVPVQMMEKEDDVRAQKNKLEEAVEQVYRKHKWNLVDFWL